MANIDELIAKTFAQDIQAKTMLVNEAEVEKKKAEYLADGWEFVSETPLNGRVKITFRKKK